MDMMIYTSFGGNPRQVEFIRNNQNIMGWCYTPQNYGKKDDERFFLDNGAWSAFANDLTWDQDEFITAIRRHDGKNMRAPDFIILPDVVGFGRESLKRSLAWLNFMPDLPWYLAVQNGMFPHMINKSICKRLKGIMVGGSVEWKEKTAKIWVEFAHNNDIKAHIGRAGTLKKLLWAKNILGADSVDSSNFVRHPENWEDLMLCLQTNFRPNASLRDYLESNETVAEAQEIGATQ